MLTYLFIITIVYEFICLIRNSYKYRKRNLTEKEKEILERNRISPETRETSFIFSIFCCIGVTLMSLVGLLFGGAFAVVIGIAFILFSAAAAAISTISYAQGFNISLIFAIYNYIMMMLFVWSVCKAI
jgi:hypothetical protein